MSSSSPKQKTKQLPRICNKISNLFVSFPPLPLLFVRWFVHQRSFDLLLFIKEPFSLVAQSNLSVVYKENERERVAAIIIKVTADRCIKKKK